MEKLRFRLVDVFAAEPLSGNGLTVVITDEPLDPGFMLRLTQELRQFETIFLTPTGDARRFKARVFTMEEELDFAGHPIVGAAAVLHEALAIGEPEAVWTFDLPRQSVGAKSRWHEDRVAVTMRQATPQFIGTVDQAAEAAFLEALSLDAGDRDPGLPMEVVTTGLPYLILPVTASGLAKADVRAADLEARLARIGAKFAYVLDAAGREGRTWDNLGKVEDIATGSAAGPVAGFLVKHGLAQAGDEIVLNQGRFTGRPSAMRLRVDAEGVALSGDVRLIARGEFDPSIAGGQ